jgi:ring-1,2-phenylacetyl-CoA epoxidase subunit PaaD
VTTATRTAYDVAATVTDPEMPMLTLEDLGVLRSVDERGGRVEVAITPTYSGCPAMATMRDDLVRRLGEAGYAEVRVRVELAPAWSSDWISAEGRRKLADYGIAPPGPAADGKVPIRIVGRRADAVACPRCASLHTERLSAFGSTACKAMYRCLSCREPFEHFKPI